MSGDQHDEKGYTVPIDRRDRLEYASCADEPRKEPFDPDFQLVLDEAYAAKQDEGRKLGEVYTRLEQNQHLPMSPHQRIRTEYLAGEYYRDLDAELDAGGASTAQRDRPLLAEAADHFRQAAEVAQQIRDWALYAQLKYHESNACIAADPKQLRRAFETIRDALEKWRKLPDRDLTSDILFEFTLADNLGLRAQVVAEDKVAVDGLDRAALMLHRLNGRQDVDAVRYANDELFIDWDWATIYVSQGRYRQAFKSAMKARRKGKDLLECINRVRLQRFIGAILLFCAEEGQQEDYSPGRLLAAAAGAIDDAYSLLKQCDDERGHVLALLADAKLLGLLHKPINDRVAKIEEAQRIASKLDDPAVFAQIGVAWGDEYAFQGKKEQAREAYNAVVNDMTKYGFLELARIAQRRIERLDWQTTSPASDTPRRTGRKPKGPPLDDKILLN